MHWLNKLIFLILLVSSLNIAGGSVIWTGDFENGNLSKSNSTYGYSYKCGLRGPDSLHIVTSPVRDGTYALYTNVIETDHCNTPNIRAMVSALRKTNALEVDGSEFYYGISIYFPSEYVNLSSWGVLSQWFSDADGSPPVALIINSVNSIAVGGCYGDKDFDLGSCGGGLNWESPSLINTSVFNRSRGMWHDFVFYIKWRKTADGQITVWHKLANESLYTLLWNNASRVTMKWDSTNPNSTGQIRERDIGIYRGIKVGEIVNQTVYFDAYKMGTMFNDVIYKPNEEKPAPKITNWSNTITSDSQTSIDMNIGETVTLSAIANQTITTWTWLNGGGTSGNNTGSYSVSFSSEGNKTVSVNATNVNGTSNNINWSIYVKSANNIYDIDENGTVDTSDLILIDQHFNEAVSFPYPRYDVNIDGLVNIYDITITGQHFGKNT